MNTNVSLLQWLLSALGKEFFFLFYFFFLKSKQRTFVNMQRPRGREGESAWMKGGTVSQVHEVKTMNENYKKKGKKEGWSFHYS